MTGHVFWQGAPAQPDPRQSQPISLTLKSGAAEYNYPPANTDDGGLFTIDVSAVSPGPYTWRAKGPRTLANSGQFVLANGSNQSVEMGMMRAGDANNDNVDNAADFNVLRQTFNSTTDLRADFDNSGIVAVSDFNLLRTNFGLSGAPPLTP